MQALFFLRKEKRWLVEKMVKEEYYEKDSIYRKWCDPVRNKWLKRYENLNKKEKV